MADRLILRDLCASYDGCRVLRNVSVSLSRGEILGLVGESGSGKSTLLRCVMGLLDQNGRISHGQVFLDERELTSMAPRQLREVRGGEISMIFQNTSTSLCPVMTVRQHFFDAVRSHRKLDKREDEAKILELLRRLGLDDGKRILDSYPFELSGGMCQRVSIALAMILNPDFLLADEPTSALDVTVQAQVTEQMRALRDLFGTGILIVSHNMEVIAGLADTIGIMYAGQLLELGPKDEILRNPLHPYTRSLFDAIPKINGGMPKGIPGRLTEAAAEDPCCCFFDRCGKAADRCRSGKAPRRGSGRHWAICHLVNEGEDDVITES